MTMNRAPDLITAYAKNLNEAQRIHQRGGVVPQKLLQRISHIEEIAAVQLTASQVQDAMGHVSRIRLADNESYQQAFTQAGNEYSRIKEDRAFEKPSAGLSPHGLHVSPEQMAQAHKNNGIYTVKNSQKMDLAGIDKFTRKKFGVSLNKFEEMQEHLLDVSFKGDDARTDSLRKQYGISKREMASYKDNGFKFHWDKKQTENAIEAGEPDSYEAQMSESAQRKTDLMVAMSGEGEEVYDDEISEGYLSHDNTCDRQGDVARAFATVEHNEINEEVNQSMGYGE